MTRKRFLYLIQGRKENVLKYTYLQNANSDLITLTFDYNILENEFKSLLNIFLPNSSWAEGRNKQLEAAKKIETEYLYYIFVDDDVEFVKGNFYDFEQKLIKYSPAIGLPLLKIIKKTNRFNPKLNVQHPVAVDQQVQAYHHKVLMESIVMPLETKFDNLSWWYSCEINGFLILSYYRGYIMQFNDIIVDNVGHHWDDETKKSIDATSNYLGGVTQDGLNQVRKYIEDKYGEQPKLRNTLFHNNNFQKHSYLPRGKYLLKFYFKNIIKGNLKKCIRLVTSQLKNNFKKYPNYLILNERKVSVFSNGLSDERQISIMNKLPISAFIISKNEGHLLESCIKSILFCDEIIVVNLESTDNTIEIAKRYGAKVLTIPTIPIGEMIYHKHINITKNKWVLMTDPDEVTTTDLAYDTQNIFHSIDKNHKMGAVFAPIIYFFKSSPLKGTSWGGVKYRPFLFHKERIIIKPIVHTGITLKEGFISHYIEYNGKNHINHFWMSGYSQIFEKHLRYLKNEGKSRFDRGHITTVKQILITPFRQFRNSYFYSKGFKDGFIGLFLSIFRAWYFTAALIELYKYQRRSKKK